MAVQKEIPRGLTITFLVILLVIGLFAIVVDQLVWAVTPTGLVTSLFFPFIYVILILEVLGRYSKRFRLNPTQMLLLMIPLWLGAGKAYITDGTVGETPWVDFQTTTASFWLGGLASPGASNWIPALQLLPSYVIPRSVSAAVEIFKGVPAGQAIPWGPFIAPMAFWSLFTIAVFLMNLSLAFTVMGPEWTETERLVFPLMVPPIYLINTSTTRDERGHSALFGLKTTNLKMFWIMVIVGLAVGGVPVILATVPAYAATVSSSLWGEIGLNWGSYIAGIMPGAYISPTFIILQSIIMILLPYEVMITSLVTWLVIPMFYDTLAVKMGWVTYVAGSENNGAWVYGDEAPFPYQIWGEVGLALGLGLYFAWRMRGRIASMLKSLTGPVQRERDFSIRTGAIVFVASTLLFYVLMLLMDVNWLIGIFWLILYFLWSIYDARVYSEIWWHPSIMAMSYWQLYWPIGAGLGIWASTPAQNNASLMAINTVNASVGNWGGSRSIAGFSPGYSTGLYKVAHDTGSSIKDVFNWMTIIAIVGVPFATVFAFWMSAHLGGDIFYSNWQPGNALGSGITGLTNTWYSGDSFAATWAWTIGGIVLIFFLMWLRGMFPWFMFNPTAFVVTMWLPEYMWLASLVALILKYAFSKSLGPRRTEELIVPAATGFAVGYGLVYLEVGLYYWFTGMWPYIVSHWIP